MRGDLLCRFESAEFECAHPTRYCHMLTRRGEVKNENSGQNDPYRYLSPRNSTKTRNLHGHIKNRRICAAESVHLFLSLRRNSRLTVRNNIKVHTHFCIEFLRWKIQRDQTVTPTGFLLHWTSDRMGFQVQRANLYILSLGKGTQMFYIATRNISLMWLLFQISQIGRETKFT